MNSAPGLNGAHRVLHEKRALASDTRKEEPQDTVLLVGSEELGFRV